MDTPDEFSASPKIGGNAGDPSLRATLCTYNIASNLAGVIAHDFNNILTGVLGNIELMQRRAKRQGIVEFNDYLDGASSAASRGVEFTQSLLAIAGHQPLEPQRIPTPDFVAQIGARSQTILGDHATISTLCHPNLADMICDELKLAEALLQLITKSSQKDLADTLVLSASVTEIDLPQSTNYALPPGHYIALSLQYNGPGMSDETAAHAFEPYFTSKNNDGLVLAKILGFARQSGGHAYIAVHQKGNTQITMLLPSAA